MNSLFEDRQGRFFTKTMVTIILSSILWITIRVTNAYEVPEWTKQNHRTQGGGWIWFPGNALAVTETEADLMAKGMAITYLMEECQIPHKEIRFNERFVEEVQDKYKVYVRASITDRQCTEGKYGSRKLLAKVINRKLLGVYRYYQIKRAEIQTAKTICRADSYYCLENASAEVEMENWYKAYIYYERSCRRGVGGGCRMAVVVARFLQTNDK